MDGVQIGSWFDDLSSPATSVVLVVISLPHHAFPFIVAFLWQGKIPGEVMWYVGLFFFFSHPHAYEGASDSKNAL